MMRVVLLQPNWEILNADVVALQFIWFGLLSSLGNLFSCYLLNNSLTL